jgi:hypothetical protein
VPDGLPAKFPVMFATEETTKLGDFAEELIRIQKSNMATHLSGRDANRMSEKSSAEKSSVESFCVRYFCQICILVLL